MTALAFITCLMTHAGVPAKDPFSIIPMQQRSQLTKRPALDVKEYRNRDWKGLYDLISGTGKGSATRGAFVTQMISAHGVSFANAPDLLEFSPDRTLNGESGGYDIYGCGKAQREGEVYRGIAVVHAVFENGDWFFTGWSFTEFPNEPCKGLADPAWAPENRMGWDQPMEEVRPIKDVNPTS